MFIPEKLSNHHQTGQPTGNTFPSQESQRTHLFLTSTPTFWMYQILEKDFIPTPVAGYLLKCQQIWQVTQGHHALVPTCQGTSCGTLGTHPQSIVSYLDLGAMPASNWAQDC